MKIAAGVAGLVLVAVATAVCAAEPKGGWLPVPAADVEKISQALPAQAPATPKTPRKLLVFWYCEGFPHTSIPHGNKMLELLAQKTGAFSVTLSTNYADLAAASLKNYDGLLLNNTTRLKLNEAQQQALLDFVHHGKGLIGIHAASDNFYDWPAGVALLGGQFDGHPWNAGGLWAFKLDEPGHPLNASFGGKGFALKDEIYQIKGPYSRATHRVLISLDMSDERNGQVDQKQIHRADKDFAVAWIKRAGQGRVFYCSLGHNHELFWNPAVVAHYLAGIQYALGDLAVNDAPSTPP
jgi:type 1 glutamine amidotransferase